MENNMHGPTSGLNGQRPQLFDRLIRAGAGAGKTTNLTQTLFDVLADFLRVQKKAPRIVVTTFTKKATKELEDRLIKMSLVSGRKDMIAALRGGHGVHISTIHSLLFKFVEHFAQQQGWGKGFRILDNFSILRQRRQAFIQVIESQANTLLLKHYELNELESLVHSAFERGLDLLFHPATQDEASAIFGNWHQNLAEKLQQILHDLETVSLSPSYRVFQETLQALAQGRERNDDVLIWDCISDKIPKPRRGKSENGVSEELHSDVGAWIDEVHECQAVAGIYAKTNAELMDLNVQLQLLFVAYRKEVFGQILSSGALSLSEVESLALQLIMSDPEFVRTYSEIWNYWMVDEFQDTSQIQIYILNALIGEQRAYYVGDPQQSIYLFRGAQSEIFGKKETEYQQKSAVEYLETNYRSQPSLLLLFNWLFKNSPGDFRKMKAREWKDSESQAIECSGTLLLDSSEKLFLEELRLAISQRAHGEVIACLGRTHDEIFEVEQILRRAGIAFTVESGGKLHEKREVIDLFSLGRFLINPGDNCNLLRVVRSHWFRVDEELWTAQWNRKSSLWNVLQENFGDAPPVAMLSNLRRVYRKEGFVAAMSFFVGLILAEESGAGLTAVAANVLKALKLLEDAFHDEPFHPEWVLQKLDAHWDGLEAPSVATTELSSSAVRLQTIHSAKGLQYDYVFVLGVGETFRSRDASRLHTSSIASWFSADLMSDDLQEKFANPFRHKARAERQQQELLEFYRVFYVAVTRAKVKIVLWAKAPPAERSWLASTPWPLTEGKVQYEDFAVLTRVGVWPSEKSADPLGDEGEAEQHPPMAQMQTEKLQEGAESSQDHEEAQAQQLTSLAEKRQWHSGVPVTNDAGVAILEQDELIENGADCQMLLSRLLRKNERTQAGIVQHALFERYAKGYAELPKEILQAKESWPSEAQDLIVELPKGFAEWDFEFFWQQRRCVGRIDWWRRQENGNVWILDYKFGQQTVPAQALKQLQYYAAALKVLGFVESKASVRLSIWEVLGKRWHEKNYEEADIQMAWLGSGAAPSEPLVRRDG